MASEDELLVRAAIRDELTGPLGGIRDELRRVGAQARQTGADANVGARGFDAMARGAVGLAKTAGRTLVQAAKVGGGALLAMGVSAATIGIKTAASMQTARIAFTTMLGSARKADAFLRQLQKFAAATPFEFPELQTAASSLISVGIKTKDVIPIMRTLGNVTAGMGTGSEGIKRATVALQQMTAAQAIHAEDLNQLRDAGIPVYDLLSSALGKSKQEVVALAQAGKLGKPALDKMMQALTTGKGLERFNGLMDKQSKSLSGVWSTLSDTVKMGLANAFQPMIPILTKLVNWFSTWATGAMPKVQSGLQHTIDSVREFWKVYHQVGASGGLTGVADLIQTRFGVDAPGALRLLRTVIGEVTTIVTGSLIPAFKDSGIGVRTFLTPIGLALKLLALMAHHTTATKIVLEVLVVALVAAKAAHMAHVAWIKATVVWEKISTAATRVATAVRWLHTTAVRIANSTAVTWLGVKALEFAAWIRSTAATVASTVATVASTVATLAARAATLAWVAIQWLLNAALSANPIGLVVIAIAALVAGIIIAYRHSKTFRDIVNGIWTAIKTWWSWNTTIIGQITGALMSAVKGIGTAFRGIGDGLKWAWDHTLGPVFGWISSKIKWIEDKLNTLKGNPNGITSKGGTIGGGITQFDPNAPAPEPTGSGTPRKSGDTVTSHARGGNIGNTLGAHAAIAGATGARPLITNAFMGGPGGGSGDHQAGRALDLVGTGLGKYASAMRDAGGFAAYHGSGAGRHLHVVPPSGDTVTSKHTAARARSYVGADGRGGSLVVEAGGITVTVIEPSDNVDVAQAVQDGIRAYERERRERA